MISIIGAGPYGLAAAAHLKAAGMDVAVFGEPMSFWSGNMPSGMLLRSPRVASSISDPRGKLDLDGFSAATGTPIGSPVPLTSFVDYGRWFQARVAPDLDRRRVAQVRRDGDAFVLALADGEEVATDRLIVAAGIAPFARVPGVFAGLPGTAVSHASGHTGLARFAGQRVLVVGGGQSALESAALLHEAGAEVDLVARAPRVRWLNQRPWMRNLGALSTMLYAPPEVGPPLLSQLVRLPGAVRRLPTAHRTALDRRSIRPAGAGWLKPRVDGLIRLRLGVRVTGAEADGDGVTVRFDDGRRGTFHHVLLGTGYHVDLARYPFLSRDLLTRVRQVGGYPVLGRGFQTSVPGLHVLGAPGAYSFGPLMRFVAGTPFAATEVARFLASSTRHRARATSVRA
jgi:FAD-dependent urate hydroxylase